MAQIFTDNLKGITIGADKAIDCRARFQIPLSGLN
jgi:hypothetical protein